MKFYLNNKEIKVLNGATFSIKKDETLDSGSIELVFSDSDTPILPMSEIRIEDNNEIYNFLISQDIVEVASKQPKTYLHKIDFVQNTRKFSKIQVRNTQFSQPANNILKCVLNATCINTHLASFLEEDEMDYISITSPQSSFKEDYYYSNAIEISKKQKCKKAYFQIHTYFLKSTNVLDNAYRNTLQDACPELNISFDLYRNNEFYKTYSSNALNNDIIFLNETLEDGIYSMKNLRVKKLSNYNEYDLFIINISLNCFIYYYSLYDVLDILRKQIALKELDVSALSSPLVSLSARYSSDNKNYDIYVTIKNTNNVNTIATCWSEGGITLSKIAIDIAAKDKATFNLGTMSEGDVSFYSYLNNESRTIKSLISSANLNLDNAISDPIIEFVEEVVDDKAGFKYKIINENSYACNLYVKFWENNESEKPSEYTKLDLVEANSEYLSGAYFSTKIFIECYFTKINDEAVKSGDVNDEKFIPPLVYKYNLYLSGGGESGSYILKQTNEVEVEEEIGSVEIMWKYIVDNNLYDLSQYKVNSTKSEIVGSTFNVYGFSTTIYWTLTVDYYKDQVLYESYKYSVLQGRTVAPSSYQRTYDGYDFTYSYPSSAFSLSSDRTLSMYYTSAQIEHDFRFNNRVEWDDIYYDGYYKHILKSSKMESDYKSSANYDVYDKDTGEYIEEIYNFVEVAKSTGLLTGDSTHNNAKDLIEDYGG